MSQSRVQYFQASGDILFASCAIGSREDGRPAWAMSCFFSVWQRFALASPFRTVSGEILVDHRHSSHLTPRD